MDIAYIITQEAEWGESFKPLKPSGRWKMTYGVYNADGAMWVEHIGWFGFKSWVHEGNIRFDRAPTTHIFECGSTLGGLDE